MVEADQAVFLPTERGLLYGDGLFETMPVVSGRALEAERHFDRIAASARALGLPAPASSDLERGLAECLRAAGAPAGIVRLTVTRGPGPRGYAPAAEASIPQLLVAAFPREENAQARAQVGVTASVVRELTPGDIARHKTLSAIGYVVAASRARAAGADEALLVDAAGRVLETPGANVFLVRKGRAATSPASLPILAGIGRARALERLGPDTGVERAFRIEDLARADEAFLTNAVAGIVPLIALNGQAIGGGQPGPVTRGLQRAHQNWITQAR